MVVRVCWLRGSDNKGGLTGVSAFFPLWMGMGVIIVTMVMVMAVIVIVRVSWSMVMVTKRHHAYQVDGQT
jgi:uncharacterized membrane protein YhdT